MEEKQKETNSEPNFEHVGIIQWLFYIIQGALIGVSGVLPGISGGAMCAVFGIYEPMIELFVNPFHALKKYYKMFIPIIIGGIIGVLGLAKLLDIAISANPKLVFCAFVGLLIGMLPSLFREGGKHGRTKGSWASLAISIIALSAILLSLKVSPLEQLIAEQNGTVIPAMFSIEANTWWYLFTGFVWGLSLVLPGFASSSVLMALGLYQQMVSGMGNLDFGVIIPVLIGAGAMVLLAARPAKYLLEKHHSIMYHMVIGLLIASTVIIIPREYAGLTEILFCILCAVGGFAVAWLLDHWGDKVKLNAGIE